MLYNKWKGFVGRFMRSIVVFYYRLMGVQIHGEVFISHKAFIDTTYCGSVRLEDGVALSRGAMILAHDEAARRIQPGGTSPGVVVLEKNVIVGTNAIILRNVHIGENSVIAAGAVVSRDIPANSVVAGNPARVVRTLVPPPQTSPEAEAAARGGRPADIEEEAPPRETAPPINLRGQRV